MILVVADVVAMRTGFLSLKEKVEFKKSGSLTGKS